VTADVDLDRFVGAQRGNFERALSEIVAGGKQSHWMWYVFPQVAGLGLSPTSMRYAINSVSEAEALLLHPVLGDRYRQIVGAVWHQVVDDGVTIHQLFGSPDDIKLVSSLTLFAAAGRRIDQPAPAILAFVAQADDVLQVAYSQGFHRCTTTERFVAVWSESTSE
jgi:uncharacterized protein (DUF1810 family)